MDRRDFERLGSDIQKTVQSAIESQDFRQLNQTIQRTINDTIYGTNYQNNRPGYRTGQYQAGQQSYAMTKPDERLYQRTLGIQVCGILLAVFGYSIAATLGLTALIFVGLAAADTFAAGAIVGSIITLIIALLGLAAGVIGTKMLTKLGRFKKYVQMSQKNQFCEVEKLAKMVNKAPNFVVKEIKKLIQKGWFRQGHLDKQESTLITTDEMYQQYQVLEKQMEEKRQQEALLAKKEAEFQDTLSPKAREVIQQGNWYIDQIHECNKRIPGEDISEKIANIENLVKRIFEQIKKSPEKVDDIRKMMDYYLPTTVKLLNVYAELDAQPVQGENIQTSKNEIEGTLDTLNVAFEKLLDDLFRNTAWDVSTDISVLQTMLTQEGLTGGGLTQ